MVQEDFAISPCGLYKSYFLLLILVVNVVKLQQKIYIYNHDTVASSEKWLTNRGILSTTQTSQPPRRKIKYEVMSSENGSQIGVFRLPFRHDSHQEGNIKDEGWKMSTTDGFP